MSNINFTIFVTTKCNLSCNYCYEKNYYKQTMLEGTVRYVVSFVKRKLIENSASVVSIRFHGGEPLIASNIIAKFIYEFDFLETQLPVKFVYSLTTNATIFSDTIKPILQRIDHLSVSIDGKQFTHDKNRINHNGIGSYKYVVENINKIMLINPDITARMTVTPETSSLLYENFFHIFNLGIHNIEFELDFLSKLWSEIEIDKIVEESKKIADIIIALKRNGIIINNSLMEYAKGKSKNAPCTGGKYNFAISPEGSVYPCSLVTDYDNFKIGNVRDGIDEHIVQDIQSIASAENNQCVGCSRYDYCQATRCKLVNFVCTGDYNIPNPTICAIENINVLVGNYYLNSAAQ